MSEQRYREAGVIALISMGVGGGLCAVKIAIGLAGGSVALVADGFESGADLLASGLIAVCLHWASRPADEDHPYGHGRIESAAGLTVGVVLVFTGLLIGWKSLAGLSAAREAPAAFTLWPLAASAIVKGGLAWYKFRRGRQLRSSALTADAWNDTVDVLSALSAAVAICLALAHPDWTAADNIGGAVVGLIVSGTGIRVIHGAMLELMDTRPEPELMDRVHRAAGSVAGVQTVETLRGRKSGLHYFFDLHVEVDPHMTVEAGHNLAHRVKDAVRGAVNEVADVLVHIEPAGGAERKEREAAAAQPAERVTNSPGSGG